MLHYSNLISNKYGTVVNILGLPVNPLTMEELLLLVDHAISSRQQLLLGVVNAAKIVNARRDPKLMQSLNRSTIILADGAPVVWLSRLIGTAVPQRVAGIDIMYRLFELSSEKNYSVYFLGAKPEVVRKVVQLVQKKYPGLQIAGFRDGYFNQEEEKEIAKEIRESKADILLVAMNSPRKENFLEKWYHFTQIPLCHGVGGSFDIVAGITKRAPAWMQKCGLEWFYRFIQEPGRMWKRYLVTNTIFIKLSLEAIIRTRITRLFYRFTLETASNTQNQNK